MKVRKVTNPSTAADTEPVRCFVAIELSKKKWVIGAKTREQATVSRYDCAPCDGKALLEVIARIRARFAKELGRPIEIVTCYEAGYDGFWLHRLLETNAIRNHVLDPASLQVDRRARRKKTDRIDAERMVRALIRWLDGDSDAARVVRVPSPEDEDARRLSRERDRLVNERVQHVNRIKGLLALQGIYRYQPLRKDRLARLHELKTQDGREMPAQLKSELLRELERLELLLEMIASVEKQRDALVHPNKGQSSVAQPHVAKIRQLAQLRAIGAETATKMTGEVFYRTFDNRRQIASYVGLDGAPFQSGGMDRDQGISKAGNPRARLLMIEIAWSWRRLQPNSALTKWFEERVRGQGARQRRIAIVALARKLLVALWRYLQTGLVPEGAVLKA